jgi:hypothetical protein
MGLHDLKARSQVLPLGASIEAVAERAALFYGFGGADVDSHETNCTVEPRFAQML